MSALEFLRPAIDKGQRTALILGVIGLALTIGIGLGDPKQIFRSYLVGYIYWVGIALGSLCLTMLHNLVGGKWGFAIRRYLESSIKTIPYMGLLAIPLLLGMKGVYLWMDPAEVAKSEILRHKSAYLNQTFFIARLVFYFLIFSFYAVTLNKWSERFQAGGGLEARNKMKNFSAPGMVVCGLAISFTVFDLVMSLEPFWYSTIYGAMFLVGFLLSTMSFMIGCLQRFGTDSPLEPTIATVQYHDLGNLMLAFTMLWAYLCFSQWLIIYSANLPEEITWYLKRLGGEYALVALALLLFHFAIPFLVLLMRKNKRSGAILARIAMAMLFMRMVDLLWLMTPAYIPGDGTGPIPFNVHITDVAAPIGIGGLWVFLFLMQLKKRPLEPFTI
jgi:hypothetical protein